MAAIAGLVRRHGITKMLLPVAAMHEFARQAVGHPDDVRTLRELITTGDRLVITPEMRKMGDALPGVTFDDHYGSTEVNVVTAPRLSAPARDWPSRPFIGSPIADARIYVLDEELNPLGQNLVGEIFVGGTPVARGYLGRPAPVSYTHLTLPTIYSV